MLRKILATALFAGFAAGLVVSVAQSLWVIPLIHQAETYETAGETAGETGKMVEDAPKAHADENGDASGGWAPEEGVERIVYTVLANVLSGVGFALILVGAIAISGREVTWRSGVLWGLAGFAAFGLAPALGLPPDPPGVDAGPLEPRQLWWLVTASATALGLALLVFARRWWARAVGVGALVLPHVIGAPHVDVYGSLTPTDLIDTFIVASLVTTGIFWMVLGTAAGFVYRKLA